MSELRTEEEQVELLKKWWNENGTSLLVSLVLVAGGWFGWNFYQDNQVETGEAAAALYDQVMTKVTELEMEPSDATRTEVVALAEQLKNDFDGSIYQQFAGLVLARVAVEAGDLDSAIAELDAVKTAAEAPFSYMASYRKARLLVEQEKFDDALAEVAVVPEGADAYKPQYLEVRGDAYFLKGEESAARESYLQAIDAARELGMNSRVLKRKADYLAASEDA